MTLAFLGHRPDDEAPRIAEVVAAAAHGQAPRLTPLGLKAVPARRPRLFALDLRDEGGLATALQSRLAAALEAEGFYEREDRPFWPHVTLARVRKGERVPEPEDPAPPPELTLAAEEVVLFRSHLGPTGARYEPVTRNRLGS